MASKAPWWAPHFTVVICTACATVLGSFAAKMVKDVRQQRHEQECEAARMENFFEGVPTEWTGND